MGFTPDAKIWLTTKVRVGHASFFAATTTVSTQQRQVAEV
jgi:hypothetical protein